MTTSTDRAARSAALDAAFAKANADYRACEVRIDALETTLSAMGDLDESADNAALTKAERDMIFAWIPASAYTIVRDLLAATEAALPALEEAVRAAETAVSADAEALTGYRDATPAETGAMLGLNGPATCDNIVFLVVRE